MFHSSTLRLKLLTVALLLTTGTPLLADIQFRTSRMNREIPRGVGQCDIRLQIDREAEVRVNKDLVSVRTIVGREARNEGSECSEPLPDRDVQGFNFEVRDSRGEILLLSPPSPRNGYSALVRIRDNAGGAGRYYFRLSWRTGGYFRESPGPDRSRIGKRAAIEICQDAAVSRIVNEHRYGDVSVIDIRVDDRPGKRDRVAGEARARRGFREASFTFWCAVDFDSGNVRSVEVRRR